MDFRQKLLDVHGEAEFKGILLKHAQDLASEQSNPTRRMGNHEPEAEYEVQYFWAQQNGQTEDLKTEKKETVSLCVFASLANGHYLISLSHFYCFSFFSYSIIPFIPVFRKGAQVSLCTRTL